MNKIVLKYDFDFDFVLIAISCPLKDYRICHFINKSTGLEFKKSEDFAVFIPQYDELCTFSAYNFFPEEFETEYYLFANKANENGYLIPEMKNTDYFILIKNFIDDEDLDTLLNAINEIPEVVVATEINPEKLKSKDNLIF